MKLFGPTHLALLAVIAAACAGISVLVRRRPSARAVRLAVGWGLIGNELIW